MIDIIVADYEELFHVGMEEPLAGTDDVCLVLKSRSPEQLLSALQTFTPHVLVLSTSFLPGVSEDPAHVEADSNCTAVARRGPRLHPVHPLVASAGDGGTSHRGCDAAGSTSQIVCSGSQLRHLRQPRWSVWARATSTDARWVGDVPKTFSYSCNFLRSAFYCLSPIPGTAAFRPLAGSRRRSPESFQPVARACPIFCAGHRP